MMRREDNGRLREVLPELRDLLEKTMWASKLRGEVVTILAHYLERVVVEEGGYVFREGDHERFLCFLISGQVEISKENSQYKSCELLSVRKGRSFGEMSLFGGAGRSASAFAREESVILILKEEAFEELKQAEPRVAMEVMDRVIADLSRLVRRTTGHLVDYLTPT